MRQSFVDHALSPWIVKAGIGAMLIFFMCLKYARCAAKPSSQTKARTSADGNQKSPGLKTIS
jgi:hypothetical protein